MEKNNVGLSNNTTPVADQANRVIDETKKLGNQIYEEGKDKLDEFQGNIKESTNKFMDKVHAKPLQSLLIAAGVGFLLSYLLRK